MATENVRNKINVPASPMTMNWKRPGVMHVPVLRKSDGEAGQEMGVGNSVKGRLSTEDA